MADALTHELAYRGKVGLEALKHQPITVCGAGAIGSHLVEMLARMGAQQVTVIDFDKVEPSNIGTQVYGLRDVGFGKSEGLAARIYEDTRVSVNFVNRKLTAATVNRLLGAAELVVDAFDNHEARMEVWNYCDSYHMPCLHIGLNGGYLAMHWNEGYRVPDDQEEGDACDVPLARTVVVLAAALAAEEVATYLATGERRNIEMTLRDLRVTVKAAH